MKSTFTFLALVVLYVFLVSGTIDVAALFNYANQPIPNYIANLNNRDNTPINNAITDVGATLGRTLFYDKNLSVDNTISCASCHQQANGFSDLATVSTGVDGTTGRHSMRLTYARFGQEDNFFWDERAGSLEEQTTQPIQDHIEMGFSGENGDPDLDSLIRKLAVLPYYQQLFPPAFNGNSAITEAAMQFALAQFIRSIQSFDSKYDVGLAAENGNLNAPFSNFSAAENAGKALYMNNGGNGSGCNRCHVAPSFDIDRNSRNNGVITVAGGAQGETDLTNIRSPTLRDLFNTSGILNGPLMHDGSFTTMDQVLDHYSNVPANANLDNRLQRGGGQRNFDPTERANLTAFLKTLTSAALYTDEKWSDPFDDNGHLAILNGICATDAEIGTVIDEGTYNLNASSSISTTCEIMSSAAVTYKANTFVTLKPGFHAKAGASFTASIAACTDGLLEDAAAESRNIVDVPANSMIVSNTIIPLTPKITIYPNPFSQSLTIDEGTVSEDFTEIYIFNAVGQQVKYLQITSKTTINVGALEKGIYFIKAIQNGQLLQTKKIVKG